VNEDETPSTAADIRALAEQAEAEATEAEALAAAARARARAIQLRRQAEVIEAKKEEAKKEEDAKKAEQEEAAKEEAAEEVEVVAAEEGTKEEGSEDVASEQDDADSVATEEPDTSETSGTEAPEDTEAAVEPDSEKKKESPTEAVAKADAEADTPAVPEEPEGRPRRLSRLVRRPKWSTVAASVAIVIILAALAGSGYMIKEHQDAVRERQRVAEFTAAARQGVVTLTSLDFNEAKQGVQRILDNSTGSFKDDFIKMADDFTKVVEQSKVISQGSVQAAAVDLDTMTNDSAVVLVASTSEITNAAGAKQDPRNYRLIVTVSRDGGQLKISKVEFVP
jgi:Mce-associated membrane protein